MESPSAIDELKTLLDPSGSPGKPRNNSNDETSSQVSLPAATQSDRYSVLQARSQRQSRQSVGLDITAPKLIWTGLQARVEH
ncbi:hypothetical protein ACLKA6_001514 [Drosophila palustris]